MREQSRWRAHARDRARNRTYETRYARLWLAASAVLVCACGDSEPAPEPVAEDWEAVPEVKPPTLPNVVLLISDDHDYEHLGFAGNDVVRTPHIDALAAAGAVLPHGHVPAGRCRPTLASLLSGRWPHQHGVLYTAGSAPLDPAGSLPNLLSQAGYATFGGGKYFEGDPAAMGFDAHAFAEDDAFTFVRRDQQPLLDFLDANAGQRPLFVWWSPMLPHSPRSATRERLERIDRQAIEVPSWYAGDVNAFKKEERLSMAMEAWLDDGVGELVAEFRERGLFESTLFVFLFDNGIANGLLSKGSVREKGVRTPLVFSFSGRIEPGQELDELVSALDVFPTVLDYADVPVPNGLAGRSLRPLLEGRPFESREVLHGSAHPWMSAADRAPEETAFALYACTGTRKYALYLDDVEADDYTRREGALALTAELVADPPLFTRGDQELFDLVDDPYERENLARRPENALEIRVLRQGIRDWWAETGGAPFDLP